MALEVNKHCVKVQYDKSFCPRKFSYGDLVILWDQAKEPLGAGNFNPMWDGPYCNVPNFTLGHNGQITFSIFMKFSKGMLKVK